MRPPDDTSATPEKVNNQEEVMQSRQEDSQGEKIVQGAQDLEKSEPAVEVATGDVEQEYPSFWKLVLLTIALCMALLVVSLDSTILATAIPRITNDFNSLNDVAWYGSSYLFAVCAFQLMFGKFYIMYPVKWVFLVGIVLFEIGSLIAGVSPSSTVLIVGRAVSGVGGAGIFAGAIIILATSVPLRQRPIYTGLLSSMHGIASVAGPLLGGAFTDHLTWRWCFYINLPLGGVAVACLIFFLPTKPATQPGLPWKEQIKQFDLPGTFFLIPSIISLLLALQWGGAQYAWDNGRIIALFVVFGILGIVFWGVEIYQKDRATVPLRILKNKNILGGVWYGVCISGAVFVFSYYLPIWFQAIKGVDATTSGLMNLPSILGLVIFAIIGGGLATALAMFTPLLIVSSAITAVGAGLLSTLKVDSTIGYWFGYQVVLAAGAGIGAQNVMLVAQVAVPLEDMAMATSIMTFTQTLASSIFLAVAQTIFQNQLIKNLTANAPDLNSSTIVNGGVTAIRDLVPPDQLPAVLQAYNDAVTQTFYVAVAVSALSIFGPLFMDWMSLKQPEKKSAEGGQDGSSTDEKSVEPHIKESENEIKDGS
ncbi:MFS transporter [Annulohypoxylon maeteangense]|uniref:MFS transporter n=1 Tax=Annulohypoxylon maeteangense TaxID=1927788 RepID=UPI002007461D|nr:MFS transporter [Annulohypoxylon maeteangense]KAI0887933.1 MFS transporter [Annulohypoxylon maeteangense]